MLKIHKIISGNLEENCYVIYDSKTLNSMIIDPGENGHQIISEIKKNGFKPEIIINTHGHYDHIFSDDKIRSEFKIPLAIHKNETSMLYDTYKNGSKIFGSPLIIKKPDILFEFEQKVKLSFATFKVIHTPGHTKGSICLLFKNFLITGDTIFAGTIGRTDLYDGNNEEMMKSIFKLKMIKPSNVDIYPGHGQKTNLSNELKYNVYLK
ncbi:MAG: MBL fold metallo-hydrolase [Endomicrobium sp.]|jgi:glyoxylase-like metal-dependent hydrolase (beta-lactamase superfamily II)|nr:MBL fold metallo-hydrolase [Endomicrobium sp.]